jgi:hypothetical protein
MKWEEAIRELSEIIPQDAGYFTLEVEQFWHADGALTRQARPYPPKVEVTIERGPEGAWVQIAGATLQDVLEKVRFAYRVDVEAPAEIEGLDLIEGEALTEEEMNCSFCSPHRAADLVEAEALPEEESDEKRRWAAEAYINPKSF